MCETILLTGATGMIGSQLAKALVQNGQKVIGLDRRDSAFADGNYLHITVDLEDVESLRSVFQTNKFDRVIHLAALAHTAGVSDLSKDTYYRINVLCAKNIFEIAAASNIPVLLISTADVYGFVKEVATPDTIPQPVTIYGKTKYLAEQQLTSICLSYDIFRFAPVYTDDIKRDIQKRYYLWYPNWAYQIGKGTDYEVLYIQTAVDRMVSWCAKAPTNAVYNVKDLKMINTAVCLSREKAEGRAKHILHFPRWVIRLGFGAVYCLTGKNKYTYLLNKVVHPLRTE